MDLSDLTTKHNLQSAWRRVTSALNTSYKAPYRTVLEAYELASRDALADLRTRLTSLTFTASPPLRHYYPKPSGLQRPITYLVIEDHIVLQALANLFARTIANERKPLEGKFLFSNYLNDPASPFAVRQWWLGYSQMLQRMEELYRSGYKWVVKFDLAAFYDTISHDLLLRIVAPRGRGRPLVDQATTWLHTWTSPDSQSRHAHGIPQGPVSSDILAESFMLAIDRPMARAFKYVRYVDDIRIFGNSESQIRQAMVMLDQLSRERGLIPQADKLGILRIRNLQELRGLAPRMDQYHDRIGRSQLPEARVWQGLASSMDPRRREILDKTAFRFFMFRAPRSSRILRLAIRLWPARPEHTDAFASFFSRYDESILLAQFASRTVQSRFPYDAVRGECWKLLARIASTQRLVALRARAIDIVRGADAGGAERLGALSLLCALQARGNGRYASFLRWERHPLAQAFVAPYLPRPATLAPDVVASYLRRTAPDPGLALVTHLQADRVDPLTFLPPGTALNPVVQAVFEEAHLIPATRRRRRDRLGALLAQHLGVQDWTGWRRLLGAEYPHVHSMLVMAQAFYDGHYTPWLAIHDSINEAVFRAFQRKLALLNAAGAIQIADPSGRLLDYGNLIRQGPFCSAFPLLSSLLQQTHDRRTRLPSSHPYEKTRGARATPVTQRERARYRTILARTHVEYIGQCVNLGI